MQLKGYIAALDSGVVKWRKTQTISLSGRIGDTDAVEGPKARVRRPDVSRAIRSRQIRRLRRVVEV